MLGLKGLWYAANSVHPPDERHVSLPLLIFLGITKDDLHMLLTTIKYLPPVRHCDHAPRILTHLLTLHANCRALPHTGALEIDADISLTRPPRPIAATLLRTLFWHGGRKQVSVHLCLVHASLSFKSSHTYLVRTNATVVAPRAYLRPIFICLC